MSSKYGELRPTSGWDRFGSLVHPNKFQRASRVGFVTAATSITGGQRNFALCLAVYGLVAWYTIYTLGGSCPLTEFCQVENSLYVQVLRSPIFAALLQHTPATGVSETLRRGIHGMELRNFRRRRHLYLAGRPSRWPCPHSSWFLL